VTAGWLSPDAGAPGPLAPGRVHLWLIHLDEPDPTTVAAQFADILSEDERRRATRFRSTVDAQRWTVSRVALRQILARYRHVDGSNIAFELGPKDKPALARSSGPDVRFNLSHSAATALVAVTVGTEVGVDVERVRDGLDVMALARRALPALAVDELESIPPTIRTTAFFRLWVRHEAMVKCLGIGLDDQSAAVGADELVVEEVSAGDGYAAAVAVAAGEDGARVSRWQWGG
jgi:4'-phosphopantetheinyl transferase